MLCFYVWALIVSRLKSHYKGTVYLLPLSFQKLLPGIYLSDIGRIKNLSQPWNHPVVLSTRPLDCEYSALTSKPLLQLKTNMWKE